MGLLGFMAAGIAEKTGEAMAHRNKLERELQASLFSEQAKAAFQERLAETRAKYQAQRDDHQAMLQRENMGIKHGFDLERENLRFNSSALLRKQTDKAAMDRTRYSNNQANFRAKLNQDRADQRQARAHEFQASRPAKNNFSPKDLQSSIRADQKEIFNLKKELNDPINKINSGAEHKQTIMDRIDSLERGVADKETLLKQHGVGTRPTLNLDGFEF
jgi:hypothetical protein